MTKIINKTRDDTASDNAKEETIFIRASEDKQTPPDDTSTAKKRFDKAFFLCIVAAAALTFVFIAYFSGFFASKDNIHLTVSELSSSYSETTGYDAIASYGFAFPEISLQTTPEDPSVSSFQSVIDNNLSYSMNISGIANSKSKMVYQLYTTISINSADAFSDNEEMMAPFIPYIQVLYKNMSVENAKDYLSDLLKIAGTEKIEGKYKAKFIRQDTENSSFLALLLTGSKGEFPA